MCFLLKNRQNLNLKILLLLERECYHSLYGQVLRKYNYFREAIVLFPCLNLLDKDTVTATELLTNQINIQIICRLRLTCQSPLVGNINLGE